MRASSWCLIVLLAVVGSGVACAPADWKNDAHRGVQAARAGELEKAEALITSALENGASAGMNAVEQGELLGWLGWVQSYHDDPSDSIPTLERAINVMRESIGGKNATAQRAVRRLAQVHSQLGNLELAEQGFRDNLEITARTEPIHSPERLGAINDMAFILARRGKLDEAQELVDDGLGRIERYRPSDTSAHGSLLLIAADIQRQKSNPAGAEVFYRQVIELLDADPRRRVALAEANAGLGAALVRQDRSEEAAPFFAEANALLAGTTRSDVALRTRIESQYPELAQSR